MEQIGSSPNTPASSMRTPGSYASLGHDAHHPHTYGLASTPSPLCKWTIHTDIRIDFEGRDSDHFDYPTDPDVISNPTGDINLPCWPVDHEQNFEERLQHALDSNSFSSVDPKDLPLDITKVAKAIRSSPTELLKESFAFSLVARNEEVFWRLLRKVSRHNFEGTGIYPLHLLTSYLDGSKTCCNLLDGAMNNLAKGSYVDRIYINNHGHTVLDNLFITILKGHTNCQPGTVDDKLSNLKRFTGEEVDICGRWDADSPCVRQLFAEGHSAIPITWKHMFCHTSAQTIRHSISRLFGPVFAPKINTPSGLFLKTCQVCKMQLELRPLHALVLTACHLAESGCAGETLFGMLACLVCLLANGANPILTAQVSLAALLRRDTATECSHENVDPVELVERIPASLIAGWTEEATLGWNVFCTTLRIARDERRTFSLHPQSMMGTRDKPLDLTDEPLYYDYPGGGDFSEDDEMQDDWEDSESDIDDNDECTHDKPKTGNFYGRSVVIGKLWAAIQTELLTYRRLTEDDPWISENFDLSCLLDGLNNGGLLTIRLVEEDMMNPVYKCGPGH